MWRRGDDDDDDDDDGMFGFSRGGSMAMAKKMMADDEVEWVTPTQEPNKPAVATSKEPSVTNIPVPAPAPNPIPVPIPAQNITQPPFQSSINNQQNAQSIFINAHGQPVNQFGQLLQFNQFGQAVPVQPQQTFQIQPEQIQYQNTATSPSSTGSINPMQASVFGGGSNSIPLSKQFAAANNFAPLGPMELEYMQAVQLQQQQQQMQMQYQQHANMIMSESASNNNMPANQATLMSESSRASTLSGSGTIPTASLSQTRRESSTQPQAQILRENSNAIQQLSRDNSLIVNKAISTPFLASTSIRNIQAIDRPSAVPMRSTPASPADIQRNNSIEIAEAIARQLKMRTESSIHSVATPPYSNQIPPPSPNDPHSLANNGKLNSFDLPVSARDDPIDPRLKLEYERAVNAFGGKKPEESDDDEGLFEKGIWGGGTSSMFLSKSSLGSRESSKEIFSGSLRNL